MSVAIVSGYFNPLHIGHLNMFEDAKSRADALLVLVNNDVQQERKIGWVVMHEDDRLRMVRALKVVDAALLVVDEDNSVAESLRLAHGLLGPGGLIFCNGGDRGPTGAGVIPTREAEVCGELGIQLVYGVGGNHKADASSRIRAMVEGLPNSG